MELKIPTLRAEDFLHKGKNIVPNYFFIERDLHPVPLDMPHRSDCYFISICLNGTAEINANIESYKIETNSLITLAPSTIKSLTYISNDYKKLAVLFTKEFLMRDNCNPNLLDEFIFFDNYANHVLNISKKDAKLITGDLRKIQRQINSNHPFKDEIVRNLLNVLLFDILSIYKVQVIPNNKELKRAEQIISKFQKLLMLNFKKQRSVTFYAGLLFISPKHLTETIKSVTGKSAGEWIDETIILEAKVLLKDAFLTIGNISDILSFIDQATFARFFKNNTGMSPLGYKKID